MGELTLIYGPMFSGKTTKLIEIYNDKSKKEKCLCFNYILDNRYGTNEIITHDKKKINCYSINNIGIFIIKNLKLLNDVKNIFINEGQFFPNLLNDILFIKDYFKINVIVCGLDYDFEMKEFGDILKLKNYATKIYKLMGTCNNNNCNNGSEYSYRLVENNNTILIGSNEYIPLCKECYIKRKNVI